MSVYFLRHGQSSANVEKTFAGRLDSPLTELGIVQANDEAARLLREGVHFDSIVSSPLSRAKDTATIVADTLGYTSPIVIDDLLLERGGGMGEGRLLKDFFGLTEEAQIAIGAESFRMLGERAGRLLAKLDAEYSTQDVLLVSHATFGEMLQAILKYDDYTKILDGEKMPNARTVKLK